MNKMHIRAILLLLIATPHAGNAINKPAHEKSNLGTFTTAELQNRKTVTSSCTGNGSSAQTIGTQFVAASVPDVSVLFRPQPNCTGYVGPTQYLETSNSNIRTFNKFTGQPDGILDIDSSTFLGGLAIADARCTFDRWGQRWIVLGAYIAIGSNRETSIVLAWSDEPIITQQTNWTLRIFTNFEIVGFVESPASFPDSPLIGTDQNAVYINMDILEPSGAIFGGFSVTSLVIPQSSFVKGNPFVYTPFYGLFNANNSYGGYGFAPSPNNYDPCPKFGYIVVSTSFTVYPGTLSTDFAMYRIVNPGSNTPSLYPVPQALLYFPAIPNYADASFVPHKGNLYGNDIATGNGVLQNFTSLDSQGILVRNHQLYIVIQSQVDSTGSPNINGDRAALVWYQYDLTGDPTGQGKGTETESTVPVLIQSGTIFDNAVSNPKFYWNPQIMTNKNGDLVITGNFAGVNDYIQAFYVGRKASDPLGTLREIVPLTNNTNSYNYGSLLYNNPNAQRWGDYCGICPDPCNDLDIWLTNEIVGNKDLWSILATQLKPVR